jgi:hypothetical protein
MRGGFLNRALLPTPSTLLPAYSLFFACCPFQPTQWEGWLDLLRRRPVTGGDVFDLQLVATMLANEVQRIEEFVSAALSEQFAGAEYLRLRGEWASVERFRAALDQIPDAEPEPHDRLP